MTKQQETKEIMGCTQEGKKRKFRRICKCGLSISCIVIILGRLLPLSTVKRRHCRFHASMANAMLASLVHFQYRRRNVGMVNDSMLYQHQRCNAGMVDAILSLQCLISRFHVHVQLIVIIIGTMSALPILRFWHCRFRVGKVVTLSS